MTRAVNSIMYKGSRKIDVSKEYSRMGDDRTQAILTVSIDQTTVDEQVDDDHTTSHSDTTMRNVYTWHEEAYWASFQSMVQSYAVKKTYTKTLTSRSVLFDAWDQPQDLDSTNNSSCSCYDDKSSQTMSEISTNASAVPTTVSYDTYNRKVTPSAVPPVSSPFSPIDNNNNACKLPLHVEWAETCNKIELAQAARDELEYFLIPQLKVLQKRQETLLHLSASMQTLSFATEGLSDKGNMTESTTTDYHESYIAVTPSSH